MDGCIYRSQFDLCEKNREEDKKRGLRRWCDFEGCEEKHPSNADRIRSMMDKELAEKMSGLESFALTCGGGWPPEKWLDWLRQEANDVGQ